MRKFTLISMALAVSMTVLGQQKMKRQDVETMNTNPPMLQRVSDVNVKSLETFVEDTIGMTIYDLQSNSSMQKRIHVWDDGTVSAVWTMGMKDDFSDRGTGYNYFDGEKWMDMPTSRLESVRTGWPCINQWGENGEIIVSHTAGSGLEILTRADKGTGDWTESVLPGPQGAKGMSWPRVITNGADHKTIHIIATSDPDTAYQGIHPALLYSRSSDGGQTWDTVGMILPGLDSAEFGYSAISGDSYAWANPVGDTIAFVVGWERMHGILMKSYDNGDTWEKTTFFQNPYPFFSNEVLVPEQTYTLDGFNSVTLDTNGIAHISFGLASFMNEDTTDDGMYSFFPYTDGLGYWNENRPILTDLNPYTDTSYFVIAMIPDINLNGAIDMELDNGEEDMYSMGDYRGGLSSMPYMVSDDKGTIYVVYSSVAEEIYNGLQYYRHIFVNKSTDGGYSWQQYPTDITPYEYRENVFPSAMIGNDGKLHVLYMADEEPGLHIGEDNDAAGENMMVYVSIDTADIGKLFVYNSIEKNTMFGDMQLYPNPVDGGLMNLSLYTEENTKINVEVMNLMGQSVQNAAYPVQQGLNHLQLNLEDLKPGMYLVNVQNDKASYTQKIMVK